jgi:hypothetical protein
VFETFPRIHSCSKSGREREDLISGVSFNLIGTIKWSKFEKAVVFTNLFLLYTIESKLGQSK